jgi:hypothetical protein
MNIRTKLAAAAMIAGLGVVVTPASASWATLPPPGGTCTFHITGGIHKGGVGPTGAEVFVTVSANTCGYQVKAYARCTQGDHAWGSVVTGTGESIAQCKIDQGENATSGYADVNARSGWFDDLDIS